MRLLAMIAAITVWVATAPAQAATILQFTEHPGVLAGLDHTDITEIEAANEAELGFEIDFLGKLDNIDTGGDWDPNTSLNPEFALLNPIFTCTSGGTDNDCKGNFTVDIDFGALTNPDWQLVKIVVKANGDPLEDWLTGLVAHDPQQQGVVSPRLVSHGVSNILLWGRSESETAAVPGPASLILAGMGVLGLGALVRRRSR